ncbi:stage V sporulation protein AD [Jeotgalibacillus sp. R-1-5s-1]|uniref:stage V sporulation protein AD n=1 Tax=Jeotgalibacillus sp. R-1-5s-1 TaxID=2555897 RepID=UPI00106BD968|nr:stage V sporulation protein AD [Jeotgalibacillus sp. R-1-5s-1]TFD97581.1 stage V sporulation protein AD [Jeotgalibacillus sp. R-1-5s-1]
MTKTWIFESKPAILSAGISGGPFEKESPFAKHFDFFSDDLYNEEKSFEKAQRSLIEKSITNSLEKGQVTESEVDALLMGDLINQLTPSGFAARQFDIPYLGLFSACATSMQGLALSAALIDGGYCEKVLTGASSHNAAVEKQFRYPTEYGGQKPPTAQWTVTGAGVVLVGKSTDPLAQAYIEKATIGRVRDINVSDPFNMGAAMSLAAADVIERHFIHSGDTVDDYDFIVTGDLAEIGHSITKDILSERGVSIPDEKFLDCGKMIYGNRPEVLAGASGPACSALMIYGYFLDELKAGNMKRILSVATGALLSPLSFQQKETIPCIAHAVAITSHKGGVV